MDLDKFTSDAPGGLFGFLRPKYLHFIPHSFQNMGGEPVYEKDGLGGEEIMVAELNERT
jgi:hypothetical protein